MWFGSIFTNPVTIWLCSVRHWYSYMYVNYWLRPTDLQCHPVVTPSTPEVQSFLTYSHWSPIIFNILFLESKSAVVKQFDHPLQLCRALGPSCPTSLKVKQFDFSLFKVLATRCDLGQKCDHDAALPLESTNLNALVMHSQCLGINPGPFSRCPLTAGLLSTQWNSTTDWRTDNNSDNLLIARVVVCAGCLTLEQRGPTPSLPVDPSVYTDFNVLLEQTWRKLCLMR